MNELRFDVFGQILAISRESGWWRACTVSAEGKRVPAGFVIPEFIEESELEQYLFDIFHESATPGKGDIRRLASRQGADFMNSQHIRQSMESLAKHFAANPQGAISQDRPAVATLESGLRCKAVGPKGETLVTDMPKPIGGDASAPTPGWFLRAALANCDATMIAMRAAQLGIELTKLEVTVGSRSDNRGLLGGSDSVLPGPLSFDVTVRIAAAGVSAQVLHDLVRWAEQHSPVGDAVRRAIPVEADVLTE